MERFALTRASQLGSGPIKAIPLWEGLWFNGLFAEALDMADYFWFSVEQWARIEPLLPRNTRGRKRVNDRRVLSGIVHALQSGGRWNVARGASTGRRRRSITASSAGPMTGPRPGLQ